MEQILSILEKYTIVQLNAMSNKEYLELLYGGEIVYDIEQDEEFLEF